MFSATRSQTRRKRGLDPMELGLRGRSAMGTHSAGGPLEAMGTASYIVQNLMAPHEKCASCDAAAERNEPLECPKCQRKVAEVQEKMARMPLAAHDEDDDERKDQEQGAGLQGAGGPEPDLAAKDDSRETYFRWPSQDPRGKGDCNTCGEVEEAGWASKSDEGPRPNEAGWWTGRDPGTKNTIKCNGSGSLVVHIGRTYQHGVTDCTRQHEQVHVNDWLARYGSDICNGRAEGDLPYYDPPGKTPYRTFLKNSECTAWRVTESCRKEKLDACQTDECRRTVQRQYDWSLQQVKKFCG